MSTGNGIPSTTSNRPIGPFTGQRPVTIPEDAFFVPPKLGEHLQDLLVAVIVRQPPDQDLLPFCIQFFQKRLAEEKNMPPRSNPDCRYIKEEKAADMLLRKEGKPPQSAGGASKTSGSGNQPGSGFNSIDAKGWTEGAVDDVLRQALNQFSSEKAKFDSEVAVSVEEEDVAFPHEDRLSGGPSKNFRDTHTAGADIIHNVELDAMKKLRESGEISTMDSAAKY